MKILLRTFCCAVVWAGSLLAANDMWACAVCYSGADSPMQHGMNMGIAVMLGVTGIVLAGLASFMVYLARRARMFRDQSTDLEFVHEKERVH